MHRTVISAYGVLDADRNVAYRSTFVVDRDGLLIGVISALDLLRHFCP